MDDKGDKKCHSSLTISDHVLVVFMKLRLNLLSKDIAFRFEISESAVSKIYRTWLPLLSNCLKMLIVWPESAIIRKNLPDSFKGKFSDCVVIIDCTEIFCERPTNLTARAQTWSTYKNTNTSKYLIGISPAGSVIFLSEAWGGRASDKQISNDCGFFEKLEPGDLVLGDRGFLIYDELAERGVHLMMPSFMNKKKQLSNVDVDKSRHLANVRIHVERVIGRLKDFRILQSVVPINCLDLMDDMMVVICGAINLNKSIVNP